MARRLYSVSRLRGCRTSAARWKQDCRLGRIAFNNFGAGPFYVRMQSSWQLMAGADDHAGCRTGQDRNTGFWFLRQRWLLYSAVAGRSYRSTVAGNPILSCIRCKGPAVRRTRVGAEIGMGRRMEKTRGVELMSEVARHMCLGSCQLACLVLGFQPPQWKKVQGSVPQWLRHWRYN